MSDAREVIGWMSALSDPARLRIVRLLQREELAVGELANISQLPQSTVSRHLKGLLEAGWITRRSVGTASRYSCDASALPGDAQQLWNILEPRVNAMSSANDDDARLSIVLDERPTSSREFFGRVGGEWDALRRELFGDQVSAEALLGALDPDMIVADIGCGTGSAVAMLAPFVKRVIAIDREPAMLEAARARLAACDNIEFQQGEACQLPLEDESVDCALLFLVLHHLDDVTAALAEAHRVVRNRGCVIVLDMVAHDRHAYRNSMGHVHLGFSKESMHALAADAQL
ncbi:MAG: ArsR/SmtB family transcription factor, partial [Phycisphaerales bacterium]